MKETTACASPVLSSCKCGCPEGCETRLAGKIAPHKCPPPHNATIYHRRRVGRRPCIFGHFIDEELMWYLKPDDNAFLVPMRDGATMCRG